MATTHDFPFGKISALGNRKPRLLFGRRQIRSFNKRTIVTQVAKPTEQPPNTPNPYSLSLSLFRDTLVGRSENTRRALKSATGSAHYDAKIRAPTFVILLTN